MIFRCLCLLIGLVLIAPVSAAQNVTPSGMQRAAVTACPPLASRYVDSPLAVTTKKKMFVNVDDTRVNFVQGGATQGCVIVTFSADADTQKANEAMVVRARLDDNTQCGSADFFVTAGDTPASTSAHTMTYVCDLVAPGSHFIRMQFGSVNGSVVGLFARVTTVHYVP